MKADWTYALARARGHAPYLERGLARLPELEALLAAGDGEAALDWAKRAGEGAPSVGSALRREKLALAVALAVGDLAGAFPLLRVTGSSPPLPTAPLMPQLPRLSAAAYPMPNPPGSWPSHWASTARRS